MRQTHDLLFSLCSSLKAQRVEFAVVEEEPRCIRLLISPEAQKAVTSACRGNGWRAKKIFPRDKYLYGMEPFLYYSKLGCSLTLCCQLACRSTMHGEWIPLDRRINTFAMNRREEDENGIPRLGAEDALCYMLAKCVYTDRNFSDTDRRYIGAYLAQIDEARLFSKLEGIFFRFTPALMKMLHNGDYAHIIEALWSFGDY